MRTWSLQEAKSRLSQVVKDAEREGPQEITVHGRAVAVLLSRTEYERLAGGGESPVEFMRRSPLAQYDCDDIEFVRDDSLTREITV